MYILTSPCTTWTIESPTIVELTVTTSTLSSLSIRRISQKMKLLSIPHVRMTWIAEPVSWTSIFACASEAFKVQPLRVFFFSNNLSFFSCAIFSFVSRLLETIKQKNYINKCSHSCIKISTFFVFILHWRNTTWLGRQFLALWKMDLPCINLKLSLGSHIIFRKKRNKIKLYM